MRIYIDFRIVFLLFSSAAQAYHKLRIVARNELHMNSMYVGFRVQTSYKNLSKTKYHTPGPRLYNTS